VDLTRLRDGVAAAAAFAGGRTSGGPAWSCRFAAVWVPSAPSAVVLRGSLGGALKWRGCSSRRKRVAAFGPGRLAASARDRRE